MIEFNKKEEIIFDYVNIFNFWLVRFILVENEKTLKDKYIS